MLKTLVMAAPGPYRRELLSFLKSIPDVDLAAVVDDPEAMIKAAVVSTPQLIILDYSQLCLADMEMLTHFRAAQPEVACLVLAGNLQQVQQANAAGIDRALLRGFSALEFSRMIEGIH